MPIQVTRRNQAATIHVSGLDPKVTEELLCELFIQAAPVVSVNIPLPDKVTGKPRDFGFVEFRNEADAEYAMDIMNGIKLFGQPLKLNPADRDNSSASTILGANLFVGNLDATVDEKMLQDSFSMFGKLLGKPRIMRDDSMRTRGFGFVVFESFKSADAAIEGMNNQNLGGRRLTVSYSTRRDGRTRHGTEEERKLVDG
ncbi:RNA recognition [Carpediemonas membranifera]|uniref:RNA recognition n=1 Tax=Carpediemonas membranifera TaxID=201153 RepID=A0A8J6B4T3_9EUKA|nr:RNA recognition [Carpediemonas membranifera]|eukprot:KAG9390042.1 RNA recognition [Carpediemonas membranifera]